jgi:hypothetical protein
VGWTAGPPTGLLQTASASIGSGNSVALIPASVNLKGVKLWSLSISSIAAEGGGGPGSSFTVDDTVTDTNITQYLACEIGMAQGVPGAVTNGVSQDMGGIVIPAGAGLDLNNGGAGGTSALRRCSATAIYSLLL